MADTMLRQVLAELPSAVTKEYSRRGELQHLRVVGHAPRDDHFMYELSAEFIQGQERLAAKIYRPKCAGGAKRVAARENANLQYVHQFHKKLDGVPRPIGDFSEWGAVVMEKVAGFSFQSIIMKAALVPAVSDNGNVSAMARRAGEWLRKFHKATLDLPEPCDGSALIAGLKQLCEKCRREGLDESSIGVIREGAENAIGQLDGALSTSAVLNEFTPLNVVVTERSAAFGNFAAMKRRGNSLEDVALFLASVEALEKYPFCNHSVTRQIQQHFLDAYKVSEAEAAILRVMKIKSLLEMFVQGDGKESGARKRTMWANAMKRFIHKAAHRSLSAAAA